MFRKTDVENELRDFIKKYNAETNYAQKRIFKIGIKLDRQLLKIFEDLNVDEIKPSFLYALMDEKRYVKSLYHKAYR